MVAEYRGATTEFPSYNMAQRIRHSTPQAPTQPRHRLDVPESAAQQDKIIRGIAATEEEQLEAQQEVTDSSDSSSSAPPTPQTNLALIAILERMQQDQARQAQETTANFAQFQARQDEFQRQQ